MDELPPALSVARLASDADINRVVLSGQIGHDAEHWVLTVGDARGVPRSQIVVTPPPGWTAPGNDHSAVVLGRLTSDPRDSRPAIDADAVEIYERSTARAD